MHSPPNSLICASHLPLALEGINCAVKSVICFRACPSARASELRCTTPSRQHGNQLTKVHCRKALVSSAVLHDFGPKSSRSATAQDEDDHQPVQRSSTAATTRQLVCPVTYLAVATVDGCSACAALSLVSSVSALCCSIYRLDSNASVSSRR